MGRQCFVPNCKSRYAPNERRIRFFKAPNDPRRLTAWAKAIGRTDRQLTPDYYVCERHFPSSVVKSPQKWCVEYKYKGNILLDHRKRAVLGMDAVPTLNLCPPLGVTPETESSGSSDKPSEMSAANTSNDQSPDDAEGSPEKAARVDSTPTPVNQKPGLPGKNSDASPRTLRELIAGAPCALSSSLSAPKNAPSTSTPKSTVSSPVTLNSSSPFFMQTPSPARFTLSSTMPPVSPMTTSAPVMLRSTLAPFSHIGAPSTLTLNRALPPLALNSSPSSTLLLMPVALIPKQGDNSPASVAMRVVPGGAQLPGNHLPGNHPPGKVTTALAFRVTGPGHTVTKKPAAAPAVVPAKREDYRRRPDEVVVVKEEVLSDDSGDSGGGSSDDGASFAEPTAAAKTSAARTTPKPGQPSTGTVRLPLSMALGADQVLLPSPSWNHHDVDIESTNARSLCFVELQSSPTSGPPFTRRILQIVQSASSGYSIRCYVLDREVEVTVLPAGSPPPTVEEIAETLQDFHARTVCRGGLARRDLPGARFERAWLDKTGVWRHDRCPLLLYGGETQCKFCASLPNPFNPPTTSTIDKSKLPQKHTARSGVRTET